MTECICSEIDVYMLEINKLHIHMMVFETMNMMTVCVQVLNLLIIG